MSQELELINPYEIHMDELITEYIKHYIPPTNLEKLSLEEAIHMMPCKYDTTMYEYSVRKSDIETMDEIIKETESILKTLRKYCSIQEEIMRLFHKSLSKIERITKEFVPLYEEHSLYYDDYNFVTAFGERKEEDITIYHRLSHKYLGPKELIHFRFDIWNKQILEEDLLKKIHYCMRNYNLIMFDIFDKYQWWTKGCDKLDLPFRKKDTVHLEFSDTMKIINNKNYQEKILTKAQSYEIKCDNISDEFDKCIDLLISFKKGKISKAEIKRLTDDIHVEFKKEMERKLL